MLIWKFNTLWHWCKERQQTMNWGIWLGHSLIKDSGSVFRRGPLKPWYLICSRILKTCRYLKRKYLAIDSLTWPNQSKMRFTTSQSNRWRENPLNPQLMFLCKSTRKLTRQRWALNLSTTGRDPNYTGTNANFRCFPVTVTLRFQNSGSFINKYSNLLVRKIHRVVL